MATPGPPCSSPCTAPGARGSCRRAGRGRPGARFVASSVAVPYVLMYHDVCAARLDRGERPSATSRPPTAYKVRYPDDFERHPRRHRGHGPRAWGCACPRAARCPRWRSPSTTAGAVVGSGARARRAPRTAGAGAGHFFVDPRGRWATAAFLDQPRCARARRPRPRRSEAIRTRTPRTSAGSHARTSKREWVRERRRCSEEADWASRPPTASGAGRPASSPTPRSRAAGLAARLRRF